MTFAEKLKALRKEKNRMDVVVKHSADLSDIATEENLFILVRIPEKFVADVEVAGELKNLKIRDMFFEKRHIGHILE